MTQFVTPRSDSFDTVDVVLTSRLRWYGCGWQRTRPVVASSSSVYATDAYNYSGVSLLLIWTTECFQELSSRKPCVPCTGDGDRGREASASFTLDVRKNPIVPSLVICESAVISPKPAYGGVVLTDFQ